MMHGPGASGIPEKAPNERSAGGAGVGGPRDHLTSVVTEPNFFDGTLGGTEGMRMQRGFSLLELLVVMATVMVLMAMAIPIFQDALLRANTASLSTDAKALYVAVKQYYVDNNTYPPTGSFDEASFAPLSSMGYYTGRVWTRLANDQADGYSGDAEEFWLEMTLDIDQSVRFLIADSDDAPLAGGDFKDGVFVYIDGELKEIGQTR